MVGSLHHLWRHHPVALSLFAGATVLVVVFVVRLALFTLYWSDAEHRQQIPEAWMTPRYVAHSWGMEPADIMRAAGLAEPPDRRMTLEQIAKSRGVPVEEVLRDVAGFVSTRAAPE